MARVTSREHIDLLVLCALYAGASTGREVVDRLRTRSRGALRAPERTVPTTLHRLARNRLVARAGTGPRGGPRYALTATGERVMRARVREYRAFSRAVEDVVAGDDPS